MIVGLLVALNLALLAWLVWCERRLEASRRAMDDAKRDVQAAAVEAGATLGKFIADQARLEAQLVEMHTLAGGMIQKLQGLASAATAEFNESVARVRAEADRAIQASRRSTP